ncbi:MAG: cell division protein FtsZ, partial [Pseudooceanicola sp.]|nr:cell division protein FtsZ [Pseudooceanicola sp.]
ELDEAANRIREEVDPDANIIVGSTLDPDMQGLMRVSVVATGIDATAKTEDIPVPRRPMSQPLKKPAVLETPAPAMPEPKVALVAEAAEEPDLFEHEVEAEADDLPPPAYRPTVPAFQPQAEFEDEPESVYVAPKPPAPGTPSPEALARLQAAAQRHPGNAPARPGMAADRKGGFGINSLINRMTGHAADTPAERPAQARPQPQVRATEQAARPAREAESGQDRIEIPAFLRRQAN